MCPSHSRRRGRRVPPSLLRLIARSAHLARYGVADAAARCACNAGAEWSKKAPAYSFTPPTPRHDNNRSHLFRHRFRRVAHLSMQCQSFHARCKGSSSRGLTTSIQRIVVNIGGIYNSVVVGKECRLQCRLAEANQVAGCTRSPTQGPDKARTKSPEIISLTQDSFQWRP